MKPDSLRVIAAINRNFAEANDAILKLTAYRSLCEAGFSRAGTGFFAIAAQALFNDMIAGAIRIFDDHKDVASIWYVIRCNQPAAQRAAQACGIAIDDLRSIAPKLRHVRDKTHFHIDRKAVTDPSSVWAYADISDDALGNALHNAALLLAKIKQHVSGGELDSIGAYDGSDVRQIINAYLASKQTGAP
jgi:hypothetical protein